MIDLKPRKTAVALGNFDGLHKGHLAVINKAVIQKDNGLLPCIVTFDRHPQIYLRGNAPAMLMTESVFEKKAEALGCRTVRLCFDDVRNMAPEEFFTEVLIKQLNAGFVVCGFNYHFGKKGSGNAHTLEELCLAEGIEFCCVSGVEFEGESISSTRIRAEIGSGEIEKANKMLGGFFTYDFEVVHGDGIGAVKIGFPTINQAFPDAFTVPKRGVYASYAEINGRLYPAMTNIGTRPTVEGEQLRSETSIIGFSGNLYGTHTPVSLIKYIRPEKKFASVQELSSQLESDSRRAKEIFGEVFG